MGVREHRDIPTGRLPARPPLSPPSCSPSKFQVGFQYVLLLAAGFAAVATVAQHALYDVDERSSSGNQELEEF